MGLKMRSAIILGVMLAGVAAAVSPLVATQPAWATVFPYSTTIITSEKLPSGEYAVTITADATNAGEKDAAMTCAIANGGMLGSDKTFASADTALRPGEEAKVIVQAQLTVAADAKDFWVYFDCQGKDGVIAPMTVTNGILTATAVGA
jgi:hypothetical protein